MQAPSFSPTPLLAKELKLPSGHVDAVVKLLDDKNTVPFIARYRKEATGGLDEVQIRAIEERRAYLLELHDRRYAVLSSIEEQGKLSDDLKRKILACATKAALEDLYLPYKPKRRTRATIAKERGLEPLAERILAQPSSGDPAGEAAAFIDPEKEVPDAQAALAGARDIAAEVVAENADVRSTLRQTFAREGQLVSEAATKKVKSERTKFEQYYDFSEAAKTIPSHRYLAIRRGEREKVLRARVDIDFERANTTIEKQIGVDARSPFAGELREAIADSLKRLLAPSVQSDLRLDLKERSDVDAVEVFADNLRNLLLGAPLGGKAVIGIDPGLRTGCKCAALDATGKYLETITIYLTKGEGAQEKAKRDFSAFVKKHRPEAIAVGNGTGGRETEAFVRALLADAGQNEIFVVQVNESGASIYSASDVAREEFPELDLTIRGAISIGRRLQDPLAELVKIEPKSIGVGQYQHDVHQPLLSRKLGEVIESCVNRVGVALNTASAPLLSYVAGIGPKLAKSIVAHREQKGAFKNRRKVLEVAGLGPRAFEQAAGFLRVRGSDNPLDTSAVHPERYTLVKRIAADLSLKLDALVGNDEAVGRIEIARYVGEGVGEPTLRDIVEELKKPGRDPREAFEPPKFRDDVNSLNDLQVGMALEGVVTNVTNFGAFVDVGVHQDGLVHVSQLADRFVRDPKEVVKVGDKIKVRVLEVDLERKRISLSAKSQAGADAPRSSGKPPRPNRTSSDKQAQPPRDGGKRDKASFGNNPFAKLRNLKK